MTGKSKYEIEIDNFRKNFADLKGQKIALYGIGRRTATLLDGIRDYQIVGLLDREGENVGKQISGISVITMEEAERTADLIIINSDPSNYEVIYQRIQKITLPVYFSNGEKAHLPQQDNSYENCEYWNQSEADLQEAIQSHEVISFDFFDTLVMRKVISPQDVFRIVEKRIRKQGISMDFLTLRQCAVSGDDGIEKTMEDIYDTLEQMAELSKEQRHMIQQIELKTEQELYIPREVMMDQCRKACQEEKTVYIISDMYLPKTFYQRILQQNQIYIPDEQIILSWEQNATKHSGRIWQIFREQYEPDRKVLHIGDSAEADIAMAQRHGIDTFYVMSGIELLKHSSIQSLAAHVISAEDSYLLGLVVAKLFSDPFALHRTKGRVLIDDCETLGYVAFGAMMAEFFLWLGQKTEDTCDRILFVSRDGYFLKRDYEYLLSQYGKSSEHLRYLYISRRIDYVMNISDEESFLEFVKFPYIGTFRDYKQSRFNLTMADVHDEEEINAATQHEQLVEWLRPYAQEIQSELEREQAAYRNYLVQQGFTDRTVRDALVDMGFQGTNQYYYQKLVDKQVQGYYFLAYLSSDNKYLRDCQIEACFNDAKTDPTAEQSHVKRKGSYLESFLTAPYGMIRYVDESGNRICEPDKSNQELFARKEAINQGILDYLKDFSEFQKADSKVSPEFAGNIYETILSKAKLGAEVQGSFYFDNDMVGKAEMQLD